MALTAAEQQELAELEELEQLEARFWAEEPAPAQPAPRASGRFSDLLGKIPGSSIGKAVGALTSPAQALAAYAAGTKGAPPPRSENGVTQAMHPELRDRDRAILKNLSNSPEASVAFLKQQYPGLEIGYENDQITMRSPDSQEKFVVDPQTGFDPLSMEGLKEAGRDVLDIGYDVPAGALSAGAGAAAAIPAGLSTAGVGAVPAAAVASGATSAGLEALRQKLGKWAGLPQEVNTGDVALSGAIGTVAPFLAGAGVGKEALKKGAQSAGKELSAEGIEKLLKSFRGGAGRATDYVAEKFTPLYGRFAGGIPAETTKALREYLPKVKELEQVGPNETALAAHEAITKGLRGRITKSGKDLQQVIEDSAGRVNTPKIREPLERAIAQAQEEVSGDMGNQIAHDRLNLLQQYYDDLFMRKPPAGTEGPARLIPDEISAKDAFKFQKDIRRANDLFQGGQGLRGPLPAGATLAEGEVANALSEAARAINTQLAEATSGSSSELKGQLQELFALREALAPYFKDPQTTFKTLSSIDNKNRPLLLGHLEKLQEKTGVPIIEKARMLEAYARFSKPAMMAQSGLGSTSTSRTVPAAMGMGSLGSLAGYKLGGGYAGAAVGGAAGAGAGAYMGSPHAIRQLVELEKNVLQKRLNTGASALPTPYGGGRSAWQALQEQDE